MQSNFRLISPQVINNAIIEKLGQNYNDDYRQIDEEFQIVPDENLRINEAKIFTDDIKLLDRREEQMEVDKELAEMQEETTRQQMKHDQEMMGLEEKKMDKVSKKHKIIELNNSSFYIIMIINK